MTKRVRKAVLPVAGLGTRVLPGAKTTPKNLLNVVDRPILSYIVEEARAAGIEHFVFIVGRGQGAIEDYFDANPEIEQALEAKGKTDILADVRRDVLQPGQMSFVRQMAPLGLGHAVWCARDIVGREPFALLLPDMLFKAGPGVLKQMMDAYEKSGDNVIAVEEVAPSDVSSYGVVGRGEGPDEGFKLTQMVEKPKVGEAPSNLIISGRYILQPEIFSILAHQEKGAGGEIQLTDAMQQLMERQSFTGVKYKGKSFDCGSKIGFLTANVVFALDRPDIAEQFRKEIHQIDIGLGGK